MVLVLVVRERVRLIVVVKRVQSLRIRVLKEVAEKVLLIKLKKTTEYRVVNNQRKQHQIMIKGVIRSQAGNTSLKMVLQFVMIVLDINIKMIQVRI